MKEDRRFGSDNADYVCRVLCGGSTDTSSALSSDPRLQTLAPCAALFDNQNSYINGVLVHTQAATGAIGDTLPGQNEFRAGGRQAVGQHFQGRIDEVRVYGSALAAGEVAELAVASGNIQWLVTDHLGTPRMVVDLSGELDKIKRHDYLPFGEELGAGTGGRTAGQGYSGNADRVRQQFTGKERDVETGLDYFGARYMSSTQGRFTSCDLVTATKGHIVNPQRWNMYVYVINNPLALYDPDGKQDKGKGGGKVIDVFLSFPQADQKTRDEIQRKIDSQTEGSGTKVRVYGGEESTPDNVAWSLKSGEARTTIVVAHSDFSSAIEIGGKNADGTPRLGAQAVILAGGTMTGQGVGVYDSSGNQNEIKFGIKAENVFVLACRLSPDTTQSIANRMRGNGGVVTSDGGDDGNINQGVAINMAIIAAVNIANGGTTQTAAQAMQAENERARREYNLPNDPQRNDRVGVVRRQ